MLLITKPQLQQFSENLKFVHWYYQVAKNGIKALEIDFEMEVSHKRLRIGEQEVLETGSENLHLRKPSIFGDFFLVLTAKRSPE